jgi:hypothetical protein
VTFQGTDTLSNPEILYNFVHHDDLSAFDILAEPGILEKETAPETASYPATELAKLQLPGSPFKPRNTKSGQGAAAHPLELPEQN